MLRERVASGEDSILGCSQLFETAAERFGGDDIARFRQLIEDAYVETEVEDDTATVSYTDSDTGDDLGSFELIKVDDVWYIDDSIGGF